LLVDGLVRGVWRIKRDRDSGAATLVVSHVGGLKKRSRCRRAPIPALRRRRRDEPRRRVRRPRLTPVRESPPVSELAVWDSGPEDGVAALVLHGGPMTDYTAPLVALLPPTLRTIRYQQRGLPPSTVEGPFDIETHVADAISVLDSREVGRAWLVGHSWGGHLAFHLAVAHPDRVLGVVAIDPLGAVPDGGWGDLDANIFARLERHSPEGAARAKELDERAMAGGGTDEEADESLRLVWPYYFARPESAPPMPELTVSVPLYAGVVASVHEHFERGTLERGLPSFAGPLAIIHGEEDPLPIEASRATAALVPHAVLEPIADAGHFPWLERPEALREAAERVVEWRGR
jgi:pimeloyl-ACP methyl ester carboxylesterase